MTSAAARPVAPALAAARHADLAVTFASASELRAYADQLAHLYDRALDDNLFLGPDFFLPLVAGSRHSRRVQAVLVWDGAPGRSDLVGFLPLARTLSQTMPLAIFRGFRHPLLSSSLPLVDAKAAEATWIAMLDALAASRFRAVLELDNLVRSSPALAALESAAAKSGRLVAWSEPRERSQIVPVSSCEEYLSGIRGKNRQELRRARRRLEELGDVEFTAFEGEDLPRGIDEFLRIEASGWKGKSGTAMAIDPEMYAFVREALTAKASRPGVRVELLSVGGKAIAANLFLLGRDHAGSLKSGYDESYRAFAPGKLLDLDAVRTLHSGRWTPRIDSLAQMGHAVEHVWLERLPIANALIAVTPHMDEEQFKLFQHFEAARLAGLRMLKDLYHRTTDARGNGWPLGRLGGSSRAPNAS
jgi:CelD/BcsL family acetyltransferase involved in cellulose biosynthesis